MQGAVKEVMHHATVTEAHFMLGGMNIDIQRCRFQFQMQHQHRMAALGEDILIRLPYCMGESPIPHRPAIDEEVLLIRLGTGHRRQAEPTP